MDREAWRQSMGRKESDSNWATELNLIRCLYYLSLLLSFPLMIIVFLLRTAATTQQTNLSIYSSSSRHPGQGLQSCWLAHILSKGIFIISVMSKDHLSWDKWTLDQSSMTEIRSFGVEGKNPFQKQDRNRKAVQNTDYCIFSHKVIVTSK